MRLPDKVYVKVVFIKCQTWIPRTETLYLQAKPSSESHYFNDGVKRIDMVLAYQEDNDKNRSKKKREVFEKLLNEQGLELETEHKAVSDLPHVK